MTTTPEQWDTIAFDIWWLYEGSGMPPLPGEDAETHVHRVTRIAWMNGAYKARENLQTTTETTTTSKPQE